ncbi:PTS transporter subunit EIIC [Brevibacterium luteolum]|uniref:PTS transporter subunit EIIC n=1 Tax=Brevibacterium luteolum TaxID=199591 RepID=UPI0021AE8525|nr:PTS transporter subunit EIIC [Brevibacterium luteolum]MCT1890791.1 PTS transporter subunit EIIC [Brevibacterium luteolum]MCT1923993.1 PTS transporter subunit EIIC [Brevibacterium luteolum]
MSTETASGAGKKKRHIPGFAQLQRVGRSLMLPIAVLPAAALLMRFGQPDMLGADGLAQYASWLQPVAEVFAAAGSALFDNLALIFAVGVAIGFAKRADGSTALAGVVGYLVLTNVFKALAPYFGSDGGDGEKVINYGVLAGIIIGIIAAVLYQRYYRIKLPDYLGFFGGRRFVPIVTAVAAMVTGVIMAIIYPIFDALINKGVGGFLMEHGSNPATGFIFGTINRLVIPFGLHHLLNNLPWFQLGSCKNAAGETLHGDITCFYSGVDGTADWTGSFMTGFFPIMMFALPAAALAIYHTAHKSRRKLVGGIMLSVALTAFVTGITEPLEYAFAYVAFPLYAVHAVLTGTSLALVNALGIKSGFGFSAGAIDYLLNLGRAAELSGGIGKVLLLIVIGLVYAAIYYFLFRWAIIKFNLHTPGREEEGDAGEGAPSVFDEAQEAAAESTGKKRAQKEGRQ